MDTLQNSTAENDFWKFPGFNSSVDQWFLMTTPIPVLTIFAAYLLFVLKVGPDYMKKRQPFSLNNVILFYNFIQVAVSVFIFLYGLNLLLRQGLLRTRCELNDDQIVPLAYGIYYYFSAKVSELLDTIFFVLRKKSNQVTFLHVYHHAIMLLSTWYTLKYEPTYTLVFLGTINSFVHIIMYTYYALSTFPALTKYLWWKKYITSMQLIQFGLIILQVSANYFVSGCPPSPFLLSMVLINVTLMIYLFSDFYIKSYVKSKETNNNQKGQVTPKVELQFANGINSFNTRSHEKTH